MPLAIVCATLQRTFVIDPESRATSRYGPSAQTTQPPHLGQSRPDPKLAFNSNPVAVARFIFSFLLNFACPCYSFSGITSPPRSVLHYAGTYVLKFHFCVGFFYPLLKSVYGCVWVWGRGQWKVARMLPGCPTYGGHGAKLWLGICIFYAPSTNSPHAPALRGWECGKGRIGGARNGIHFCWCRDFFFSFLIPCTVNRHDMQMIED